MKIGTIETFIRIHRLSRAMHPALTINNLKHQILMMVRVLFSFQIVRKWFDISDNPLLAQALQRYPLMSGAIYWPYINNTWSIKKRLSVIDQHFRMLAGQSKIIAHATFEDIELARLDEKYDGLRLVLDKAAWFLREGEIVLNLFINEQRFYSIAFTLGIDSNQAVVFVGALQGSNSEQAQEIYRDMTHALHGMRPRDLLLITLKMLCAELGIRRIWAVSSKNRQHNSPYFGGGRNQKVLIAYNEVWLEQGGTALDNGFFDIPAIVRQKDMSEIPARKRANYRRRYQMLDKLAVDIKTSCTLHAAQPLSTAATIQQSARAKGNTMRTLYVPESGR